MTIQFSVLIQNVGVHYETWNTGVVGPVVLHGLNEGSRDLTWQTWSYQVYLTSQTFVNEWIIIKKESKLAFSPCQVGLKGEQMNLNSLEGSSSVEWMQGSLLAQNQQPLAWYKV